MSPAPSQIERHKRHILLKEIGGPGLAKLRAASVSIIGAGALGGPCAMYLAAAGIGHIEIWDDDSVDLSNLQRQIQFSEADIGQPKASILAARLLAMDGSLEIIARGARFKTGDIPAGDIVIDASDNFETRYALNQLAHAAGRALVHGAASGWTGQAAVFVSGVRGEENQPCYQCWVPETPPEAEGCDEVGVVGAITGMVAARMALETIKRITGAGDSLASKLWLLDGLSGQSRTLGLKRDPACPVCGD